MRPLTKLFLIFLISFLLVSYIGSAGSIDTVSASGPKMKDLFVLKTNRKFVGATVEIISTSGEVITSSQLQKRKLVIDFEQVRFGAYTIRLTKGDRKEEFIFIKN
jgi:cytochrome oxidase Cu insertion factor (SCO1/SenC/PrrC family)